jgi:hypothetical protein
MPFWYNVSTHQVETDDNRSAGVDVLGPFDTREEAEAAIETAHKRTEIADEEDAVWTRGYN